jgi:tRNA-specific 2-thiouridylase
VGGLRVLAALSGGVDSAVAAARVRDAGHDVTGVHLALSANPQTYRSGARGCCSLEDSRDARRVADKLGIPFYVWDMAAEFHQAVVEDFLSEYAAGRTPNPCLRCNESIKFSAVLQRAKALGYDAVATGHYAQVRHGADGVELHRAVDAEKDQSYVLAILDQRQIEGSMFPLGDSHKSQVRQEAAERGLLVADKPDSHDICFIADGDTRGFLAERLGRQPGHVVDQSGTVVGEHEGAYAYTVGQRRGLGLSVATADRTPRYVLAIEPLSNTVTVGPRAALEIREVAATQPRWCGPYSDAEVVYQMQMRAHGATVPGTVELRGNDVLAKLVEPTFGVAPGQTLAIYEGSRVRGSATITACR